MELHAFTNGLDARNSGRTTEDELMRLRIGYNRLANAAEHCRSKSTASESVAKAVIELRQNLTSVVNRYDQKVEVLVAQNTPESLADAIKEILAANAEAAEHSSEANSKIVEATQRMFNALHIEGNAQQWLQDNGAQFGPPSSQPPTVEALARKAAGTDNLPFPFGTGDMNNHAATDGLPFPFSNMVGPAGASGSGQTAADQSAPNNSTTVGSGDAGGLATGQSGPQEPAEASGAVGVASPAGATGAGPNPGTSTTVGGNGSSGIPSSSNTTGSGGAGSTGTGTGGNGIISSSNTTGSGGAGGTGTGTGGSGIINASGGQTNTPNLGPPSGGTPAAVSMSGGTMGGGGGGPSSPLTSAMPGVGSPGGGMPPGLQAGGPAQAFPSGMPGGPPGPGGPQPSPLTPGGPGSSGFGQGSASPVPPSPSVTPMSGGMLGNMAHLASSGTEVTPTAATAAPAATPAPPVSAGPSSVPSAPISAGPAGPSGPLPSYGADLRPAGGAAPSAPAGPLGSSSPTPPPGGPTTPASGGATVASTGDRPAPGKPSPGVGGQSGASVAGSMGAGGTAGAGAGTAARRLAEHEDLQRKVDAVARQSPQLAWAAGLRDDETTVVLTTDLAGGWIPPTVELPPGVTLLDPAHRRRDTSAVDLLGAVVAVAAHQPNTYITEAGPHDLIAGSGERARYGQHVDELGPTLINAAVANTRLPRIVQTVARAMARRSGVADNESELFRQVVTDTQARVLSAYPQHAPRDVADWMLLAAIDALIDGSEELARYHLAWHLAVAVRHGGVTP